MGRDLNPGPPTNAALLPNRPRHSVGRNSTDYQLVDMPLYVKLSHTTYGVAGECVPLEGAEDDIWV